MHKNNFQQHSQGSQFKINQYQNQPKSQEYQNAQNQIYSQNDFPMDNYAKDSLKYQQQPYQIQKEYDLYNKIQNVQNQKNQSNIISIKIIDAQNQFENSNNVQTGKNYYEQKDQRKYDYRVNKNSVDMSYDKIGFPYDDYENIQSLPAQQLSYEPTLKNISGGKIGVELVHNNSDNQKSNQVPEKRQSSVIRSQVYFKDKPSTDQNNLKADQSVVIDSEKKHTSQIVFKKRRLTAKSIYQQDSNPEDHANTAQRQDEQINILNQKQNQKNYTLVSQQRTRSVFKRDRSPLNNQNLNLQRQVKKTLSLEKKVFNVKKIENQYSQNKINEYGKQTQIYKYKYGRNSKSNSRTRPQFNNHILLNSKQTKNNNNQLSSSNERNYNQMDSNKDFGTFYKYDDVKQKEEQQKIQSPEKEKIDNFLEITTNKLQQFFNVLDYNGNIVSHKIKRFDDPNENKQMESKNIQNYQPFKENQINDYVIINKNESHPYFFNHQILGTEQQKKDPQIRNNKKYINYVMDQPIEDELTQILQNDQQNDDKDLLNQSFGPVGEQNYEQEDNTQNNYKEIENFGEDELFVNNFNQISSNDQVYQNNPFQVMQPQFNDQINYQNNQQKQMHTLIQSPIQENYQLINKAHNNRSIQQQVFSLNSPVRQYKPNQQFFNEISPTQDQKFNQRDYTQGSKGHGIGEVFEFLGKQIKNIVSGESSPQNMHMNNTNNRANYNVNSFSQELESQQFFNKQQNIDESDQNRSSAEFGSGNHKSNRKIKVEIDNRQNIFYQSPKNYQQQNFGLNNQAQEKDYQRQMFDGRRSSETKASSSQSAFRHFPHDRHQQQLGLCTMDALEIYDQELTEFEKIEMGMFERIYTIGKIRRQNQYQIADKDGQYLIRVGEHIGYRYEVIKLIDKGAFGQVVKCIDYKDPNQRVVAAKISKNKKFDVDNANVEIKILNKLQNFNGNIDNEGFDCLVQMIDSFRFRQHVIIIFECLSLNLYNFQKMCKRRNQISFTQELLQVVSKQICQGLKFMKNKGIIHCDMKPENILFTDDYYNRIKLIDFGASCEDCSTGFFYVQSRYYRAPEIVLGIDYDHAVDMWSVGCILYEMVVGQPIFPAKDENDLLEYFIVTLGQIPNFMIKQSKKYNQFFQQNLEGQDELIRSSQSSFPQGPLIPKSQPISHLLMGKCDQRLIEFIQKCLVYESEDRLQPQTALHHAWLVDIDIQQN